MQVFAYYTSVITDCEVKLTLKVEDGAAEWVNENGARVLFSPRWASNHFDSLDWFKRVYKELKPRFELK
jgi:hypothetical protein